MSKNTLKDYWDSMRNYWNEHAESRRSIYEGARKLKIGFTRPSENHALIYTPFAGPKGYLP